MKFALMHVHTRVYVPTDECAYVCAFVCIPMGGGERKNILSHLPV